MSKPAPLVRGVIAGVDEASREQRPSHGMSARQRTWLACGIPAVRVTHARCGARVARASRGPSARAAWSWMWRHRQSPWDERLVARVRVIRGHDGLTAGRRVLDATDQPRAPSAKALAPLDTRREHERGGALWGQRRVWLWFVTPTMASPVGVAFDPPAPALSAWSKTAKALPQPGVTPPQRPPTAPTTPAPPPTPQRA